jgi:hypothetical protein
MRASRSIIQLAIVSAFAFPASGAAARDGTAPPIPAPSARVRAWQTGAFAPDRLQHASLAFSAGLGLGIVTRQPAVGACGALGLGLAKEIADRRRGRFDPGDLAADAVGAGLAALAARSLTR